MAVAVVSAQGDRRTRCLLDAGERTLLQLLCWTSESRWHGMAWQPGNLAYILRV